METRKDPQETASCLCCSTSYLRPSTVLLRPPTVSINCVALATLFYQQLCFLPIIVCSTTRNAALPAVSATIAAMLDYSKYFNQQKLCFYSQNPPSLNSFTNYVSRPTMFRVYCSPPNIFHYQPHISMPALIGCQKCFITNHIRSSKMYVPLGNLFSTTVCPLSGTHLKRSDQQRNSGTFNITKECSFRAHDCMHP